MEIIYIAIGFIFLFSAYLFLNLEVSGHPAHITLLFIYMVTLTCYLLIIKDIEYVNIPLKTDDISVKANINTDIYLGYRVTETDSTITIHLFAKK